jgi:hypothetical protein
MTDTLVGRLECLAAYFSKAGRYNESNLICEAASRIAELEGLYRTLLEIKSDEELGHVFREIASKALGDKS